ncbi:PQQ-binding-like beta-propeller repeat protein [Marinilongibacter aquaticus]|uniref:outer membrane protein assembly factor BamB family protein n=1 Tax=Marinilongibacter aquaticus TaxID=2975157 RepID=UPI0021BDC0B8|nr:PQQ-binding-like beta-propeller repeat protein [Marinilongibacter aquaticus]UBM59054.1 PQQ-binding-like beta-propeller repeat protein [Marinilongibacter aquaticus]
MLKKVFLWGAAFLLHASGLAFGQLSGKVFVDENGNGRQDKGEKVYQGAVVSDGLSVVKTDKDGHFELPGWEKQHFVAIYPSSDFNAPVRYWPIKPEVKEYNFAVRAKAVKKDVSFVHISDTETFQYGDWVDDLKRYAQVNKPDFIVHTGDICYESGMKWHSENLTEKELGVPVYYCLGNHDLIKGEYGEAYFESRFGPAWYAFEEGNALYVITPMMGGDYPPGFDHKDIGTWLKNLLQAYDKAQDKYFFNHDLLTSNEQFDFAIDENEKVNLNQFGLKAWFYGHMHVNMTKEHGDTGIRSFCTSSMPQGGIDHSPSSFREVKVSEDGHLESTMKWTYLRRNIRIVNPNKGLGLLDEHNMFRVSVNVYDCAAEVERVRYSVWGEEGFNWTSALQEDQWAEMQERSDWNWEAELKLDTLGKHTLVVDAYLKSGEVVHRKTEFIAQKAIVPKQKELDWGNLSGNAAHLGHVENGLKSPFVLQWSTNLGSNVFMSSPVLYSHYVLSSGFDDGEAKNCFIVCLDANSGKERWRFKSRNGIKNQMVVAKGLVIATDMEGFTYALDIESGELIWQKSTGYNRKYGFVSGIVSDGSLVYTGFSENLRALEATTGRTVWQAKENRGGYGATTTMTIADNVLIVSRQWGGIDAFDKNTGRHLWTRNDAGLRFRDGNLTYAEGFLWVAERFTTEESRLHKIDLKTGETLSYFDTQMKNTGTSCPIVWEDKIFVAGSHPGIAAFDRKGERLWLFEVGEALFYTPSYFQNQEQSIESSAVLVGKQLIFAAMDGHVYVLNAENGKLLWKNDLGAPLMTAPAVATEGFYICDFAGNVYFFKGQHDD